MPLESQTSMDFIANTISIKELGDQQELGKATLDGLQVEILNSTFHPIKTSLKRYFAIKQR